MTIARMTSISPHEAEPSVPGTVSEGEDTPRTTLWRLLREGALALIVALVLTGIPSAMLGTSQAVRRSIVIEGFAIFLVGIVVAKTLGGRLLLAAAYAMFYQRQYFLPPSAWIFEFTPSTGLVIVVLVLEAFRPWRRDLLTHGELTLRPVIFITVGVMSAGILYAAAGSYFGPTEGLRTAITRYGPVMLFAWGGALCLRRGDAGIFLDLLPILAAMAAVTVWVYNFTGEKMLFYQEEREVFERFGGMLRNPNNTGFFCLLTTLICLARIRFASPMVKVLFVLLPMFLMGTLLLLRSRTPVLLFGLFLPVLIARKSTRRHALLFLILGVTGYVAYGTRLGQVAQTDLASGTLLERLQETSAAGGVRWRIALDALEMITRHPTGIGEVGGVQSQTEIGTQTGLETHNEYLAFLVKNGFQSAVPLLLLAGILTVMWVSRARQKLPHRPGAALLWAVVVYLTTFNFEPIFANSDGKLTIIFGAILGMFTTSSLFASPQAAHGSAPPGTATPTAPVGTLPGDLVWWPAPRRAQEPRRP